MATSLRMQQTLLDLQAQVAPIDPSILELDPSELDDAILIAAYGSLIMEWAQDAAISVTKPDGHRETLRLSAMGKNSQNQPIITAQVTSNDGTLDPSTKEIFVKLHRAEK